jgi:hypothetical protein
MKIQRNILLLSTGLLLAAPVAAENWFTRTWNKLTGKSAPSEHQRVIAAREELEKAALADLLKLNATDQPTTAYVALPQSLLADLVSKPLPVRYSPPGQSWTLVVSKLSLIAQWGALEFKATAAFESANLPTVAAELGGHFIAGESTGNTLASKLRFSRLAPVLPDAVPDWARPVLTESTLKLLNDRLPPIPLPISHDLVFPAQALEPQSITLPLPNGSLTGNLNLPPIPEFKRRLSLRAFIPTPSGLFLAVRVAGEADATASASVATVEPLPAAWASAMERLHLTGFKNGLPDKLAVVIGTGIVQALIADINALPEAGRTITFQGTGSAGDIMAKTGGAPFGNGFKVYFEGADRAKARGALGPIQPTFADGEIRFTTSATVSAEAQLHFHGNAPQVKKRVFGFKIVDVKVGGGIGTSFGASASAKAHQAAGVLKYDAGQNGLVFILTEPNEVPVHFDIGGFPGEIEKWLRDQFKAKLPTDKPLAKIALPALVTPEIKLNDPAVQVGQPLRLSSEAPEVNITPHYLILKAKVILEPIPATP